MATLQRAVPLVALALAAPASATWSIVVVNHATREVAVACATCIENIDLLPRLPAVRAGYGAGNVQAWWDDNGSRRLHMWEGFGAGETPEEILAGLRSPIYQYGIANFAGPAVTYTGENAQDGVCGVAGSAGELSWAIQGNVIAGQPVCLAAEAALVDTPGDLATKVMAAMEAARAMGGDGRCSCSPSDPDGCGSPPPGEWKSAHTSFVVVARVGDDEGPCLPGGCPDAPLYLARSVVGDAGDPDPILVLAQEVLDWREKQKGRPDQILSEVFVDRDALVADGSTRARVTVVLRDVDGAQLPAGGAQLAVEPDQGPPVAVPGPVTDHGDGSYSFDLVATATSGRESFWISVDFGGNRPRVLYPPLSIASDPPVDLHAGLWSISASAPRALPLVLGRGPDEAGEPYHLLMSAAGNRPGISFGGVLLPLNRDGWLELAWSHPDPPVFEGFVGALDGAGRAEAWLDLPPRALAELVGERLEFCALLGAPPIDVTSLAGLWIVP